MLLSFVLVTDGGSDGGWCFGWLSSVDAKTFSFKAMRYFSAAWSIPNLMKLSRDRPNWDVFNTLRLNVYLIKFAIVHLSMLLSKTSSSVPFLAIVVSGFRIPIEGVFFYFLACLWLFWKHPKGHSQWLIAVLYESVSGTCVLPSMQQCDKAAHWDGGQAGPSVSFQPSSAMHVA